MRKIALQNTLRACMLAFLLLATSVVVLAQNHSLVGRVTDEQGELMIGVTIQEKGSSNATITDINGQYSINLSSSNSTILVSFIGYKTQEIKVGKRKMIDIALTEDVSELDEVVVVGYGQQRKVSVVGAQSSVKVKELKTPGSNLSTAISGRIAGVVAVQRSGEPGHDGADIWIRGISTFTGQNSKPLVLVDGVERDFNNIDPEDIESFTVLKDASATAVYGVRGANGVVIVKTKPGVVGTPKFSFDYNEGFITMTKRPELADAYTYMDAANEAYANDGKGVLFTPQYIEATKKANGMMTNDNPQMYNSYLYPAVDWMKEIFNDWGHNRRINASVRGGVPNANYYVSLTYYTEKGLLETNNVENYDINMKYDRYNFTSNLNLKPTKRTTIDLGFSGYISEGNYPQQSTSDLFGAAMAINPVYLPLMMPDGTVSGISGNGDMRNPYADLVRRGYKNEHRTQINSNIRVTQDLDFWKWSKGLKATAMIAFDTWSGRDLRYNKREDTYYFSGSKDENGLWKDDVYDADGNYRMIRTYTGQPNLSFNTDDTAGSTRTTYFEASLNYDRSFGLHRVGGLFLYNHRIYRNAGERSLINSLPYKQQGIAARATYSWNDRYFAEFNLGYNGSENFAPNKRFGTFPAFGLGWAVSNESFGRGMKKYISYLKFRYTDGKVGNDVVAGRRFMYQAIMGQPDSESNFIFVQGGSGANAGWGIQNYGVENITWSTSRKQDLGIDLKFWDDALSLNLDLFKERRDGIFLRRATIPGYAGFVEMPYGNLGIVENKGIEASLEFSKQLGKKVFLTVRGNVTYNEDKIIEDDQPAVQYPWRETRGTNVLARWGFIAEGLFTSEEEIANHATQFGTLQVGDIKYKDLNEDGIIDDNDKCVIGQGDVPKIYYGFGADLQVGRLSFGAVFQGIADVDRCLSGNSIQPFSSMTGIDNLYSNIGDRWSADDPTNQDVFYPRLHNGQAANTNNNQTSTWWQKDMSFLRLKQLTISYDLPDRWISKAGLKNARIYVMGTNLLTFSKFKLWDPELNTNNGTSYPNVSTYSLGLSFGF